MSTINYGSSNYVNLGLNLSLDIYQDFDNVQILAEDVKNIIYNKHFQYFTVDIIPGYYEGFYLDIKYKDETFYNYEEKKDAQKEVTKIKKMLYFLSNMDIVRYTPGWCTGYNTPQETKKDIANAIKQMRRDVKDTPTEYNA